MTAIETCRTAALGGHVEQCDRAANCSGHRPTSSRLINPIVVNYRDRYEALTGRSLRLCPRCHTGQMILVEDITGARHATRGLDTS